MTQVAGAAFPGETLISRLSRGAKHICSPLLICSLTPLILGV